MLKSLCCRLFVAGLLVGASAPLQAREDAANPGYEVVPWRAGIKQPLVKWTDLQGKVWRLADLRGKAAVVNFWASWCEPCRAEMPSLQTLAVREAGRVVVITVNLKESSETVQRFVQQTRLELPVVRDVQGDMAKSWDVRIYPSTVLITPQGRVYAVVRGALDWAGPQGEGVLAPLLRSQRDNKR
jgi:thiol-disulfide isomerase/thioredoxin